MIFSKRSRRRDASNIVGLRAVRTLCSAVFSSWIAATYFWRPRFLAEGEDTWCERKARLAASMLKLRCSGANLGSKYGYKKSQPLLKSAM